MLRMMRNTGVMAGSRFKRLMRWEETHSAERYLISKLDTKILIQFFVIMFMSMIFIGFFPEVKNEMLNGDPHSSSYIANLFVGAVLFIILLLIIYIIYGLYQLTALNGYYFTDNEFIKVQAFWTKTKETRFSLHQMVTFDQYTSGNGMKVSAVFCADYKERITFTSKVFKSLSINRYRYYYFPVTKGYNRVRIWGETIYDGYELELRTIEELIECGRNLLVKYTGSPLELFKPELHCQSCYTLNNPDNEKCSNCGYKIFKGTPETPTYD